MHYYLLGLAGMICIIAFIVSIVVIRKQKDHEYDKGMNNFTAKHTIVGNPILIAYVLFPILIIVGAILFIYYYGG